MIQVSGIFGAQGGLAFDIKTYSTLPALAIDNQLALISSRAPAHITFDVDAPAQPALFDVWIQHSGGQYPIRIEKNGTALSIRPQAVQQFNGVEFAPISAYVGVSGEWVRVSTALFGASHNTASSLPVLTRLGSAVGLIAVSGIGALPQTTDFDAMPIFNKIRLCNLTEGGVVTAYEGDAGFKRDGSNGHVMVEIPQFFFKIETSGAVEEWWIREDAAIGYSKHAAFSRSGIEVDRIYISAYEAGAGYVSRSGVAPVTNMTRANARTAIMSKGSGWMPLDAAAVMAVNMLMYIEYANLNLQDAIAQGNSNGGEELQAGNSDSMAGHTGRPSGVADAVAMKWRGLENWWGNNWTWVDGLNVNGGAYYFTLNPSKLADATTTGYTSVGYSAPTSLSGSYVKTMGLGSLHKFLRMPTAGGGSDSTYYCDSVYTATGWKGAAFGGNYNLGNACGAASWYIAHDAAAKSERVGCRLIYLPVNG